MILAVVGAVAVAAAAFFFAVRPRQQELGRVRADVEQEENRTQQLEAELARLQQLQRNAPELEARLARYRELVPEDDQVPNFIFQVQEAANQAGVGFVEITPELPKPPPEGAQVAEVRTLIGAKGGYFAVQDFFRRLYDLDRAVRVDNLTMAGAEDETTGETLIDLDMTARVFFELPAGAAAAAPTTETVPAPAPVQPTS
jgi:Tfp pilus assembly protein PilO